MPLDTQNTDRLLALVDRFARLSNATMRDDDLNPAQRSALGYLAVANRFSRSPSQVAEYLAATRGTVSQTLKALERKGFVAPQPDPADKRSLSYDLTDAGRAALARGDATGDLIGEVSQSDLAAAEAAMGQVLAQALAARGYRSFGICRSCRHHDASGGRHHCRLLDVALDLGDSRRICAEHAAAD